MRIHLFDNYLHRRFSISGRQVGPSQGGYHQRCSNLDWKVHTRKYFLKPYFSTACAKWEMPIHEHTKPPNSLSVSNVTPTLRVLLYCFCTLKQRSECEPDEERLLYPVIFFGRFTFTRFLATINLKLAIIISRNVLRAAGDQAGPVEVG